MGRLIGSSDNGNKKVVESLYIYENSISTSFSLRNPLEFCQKPLHWNRIAVEPITTDMVYTDTRALASINSLATETVAWEL